MLTLLKKKSTIVGIIIIILVGVFIIGDKIINNKSISINNKKGGTAIKQNNATDTNSTVTNQSNATDTNSISAKQSNAAEINSTVTKQSNTAEINSTVTKQSNTAEINSTAVKQSNTTNTNSSITNNNNTSSTFDYKDYFGEWVIKKSVGTLPVYAIPDSKVDSYIGKKLILSANQFTDLDGSSLKTPTYKQKIVSDNDFFTDTKRNLSYFKITSNYINEIEIDNNGGMYSSIYIIDKNTIMYLVDGVFFQLQK
ncbi:hypothetical protein [Clostridium pasteurianum]|uniref:Uncharacterized protein n=1 Tax=Clostridium pasteurianum BC1 TaxID=86416 RepID=R4JX70_CLOPA|nr:hypothetical protein [Clostridium pasteurianum]AGK95422.1 hypothetical protein Clopa_0360 [Clostridium pasteurianum BC1]